MSVPNRIKVEVMGSCYFIATTESEEYIRDIEKKFNEQIKAIMENRTTMSLTDALVLMGLNIFDNCQKAESSAENMRRQLSEYFEDAGNTRVALEDAHKEIERLNKELAVYRRAAAMEENNV